MKKKRISLNRMLVVLVVLSWIVPVLLITGAVFFTYRANIVSKTRTLIEGELINYSKFVSNGINEAVTASKKISYDHLTDGGGIQKLWERYIENSERGIDSSSGFQSSVRHYLSNNFGGRLYRLAVFYLVDEMDIIHYYTDDYYKYRSGFNEKVKEAANRLSETDDMETSVVIIDNRIYVIRNLYTISNYRKFGTLILELNQDELFKEIDKNDFYEVLFYIDDASNFLTFHDGHQEEGQREAILRLMSHQFSNGKNQMVIFSENNQYEAFLYKDIQRDFTVGTVILANKQFIYNEFRTFLNLVIMLCLIIVPILIFVIYFFRKQIYQPMQRLIGASKAISKGDIGHQIEEKPMPNEEFYLLGSSFNKMSWEVKQLFEYTYNEEIARKDAKILALQSQINPHFLNNTLEMMNWQARMSGDAKISKMIKALSTLLDYSMGRDEKRLCSLAEELRCADAYFYIISMRFGNRLFYEKDIDEELLGTMVPQLILQPIIENAVVHGIEKVKKGIIKLRIFKKEENVCLQVINTGVMTKEDEEKIKEIINEDKHSSLGIKNVNERLHLIYGESYEFTICAGDDNQTISTIIIPVNPPNSQDREKLLNNILNKGDLLS